MGKYYAELIEFDDWLSLNIDILIDEYCELNRDLQILDDDMSDLENDVKFTKYAEEQFERRKERGD